MSQPAPAAARELFVRHARKEGRSVAVMRAVDYGDSCVVEAEVYPGRRERRRSGPVRTPSPTRGRRPQFVTEAVEALMYLGCDIQAQ